MTRPSPADRFHGADLPQGRHDTRHEPLLRAAISGEIDGRDPRWAALLDTCDHCREQFEGLVEVRRILDGAADDERDVLSDLDAAAASERESDVPGRELVAPFVREQLALAQAARASGPRIRREWWQAPWVAAAAAGILVAGWFARGLVPQESELGTSARLGAHEATDVAGMVPSGRVQDFGEFKWRLQAVPGGRFHVTVRDGRPEGDGGVIAEVDATGPGYTFSPETTRTWPDQIQWEVQAQDVYGRSIRSTSATAQR